MRDSCRQGQEEPLQPHLSMAEMRWGKKQFPHPTVFQAQGIAPAGLRPSACPQHLCFDHQLEHPRDLHGLPPELLSRVPEQREVEAQVLPTLSVTE